METKDLEARVKELEFKMKLVSLFMLAIGIFTIATVIRLNQDRILEPVARAAIVP